MADERFFLKVPPNWGEMTPDQQEAAAYVMWQQAMRQMGRDPRRARSSN
jgi:hypothetical protein